LVLAQTRFAAAAAEAIGEPLVVGGRDAARGAATDPQLRDLAELQYCR
jgi:hypothetical protein